MWNGGRREGVTAAAALRWHHLAVGGGGETHHCPIEMLKE